MDFAKIHCSFSFVRNFTSSILRKFAGIAFSLVQIFVDISLLPNFASSIFRCPQRNFADFRMSNVWNFKQKFAKFSRNFDLNKVRILSKFTLITFAQHCMTYDWYYSGVCSQAFLHSRQFLHRILCVNLLFSVVTKTRKTWNHMKPPETTWNHLKTTIKIIWSIYGRCFHGRTGN